MMKNLRPIRTRVIDAEAFLPSQEQLEQLAQDIMDGKVWGSWSLGLRRSERCKAMRAFAPFQFGSPPEDRFCFTIGEVFAYLDQSNSRERPLFMHCWVLTVPDAQQLGRLLGNKLTADNGCLPGSYLTLPAAEKESLV